MAKNKSKRTPNKPVKRRNSTTPTQKKKKQKRSLPKPRTSSNSLPPPKYQSTPVAPSRPKPNVAQLEARGHEVDISSGADCQSIQRKDGEIRAVSEPQSQPENQIHFSDVLFSQFRHPRPIDEEEIILYPIENESSEIEIDNEVSNDVPNDVPNDVSNESEVSTDFESTNQTAETDDSNQFIEESSDSIQAFTDAEKAELKKFRKEGIIQRNQMSLVEKTKILWYIHGKKEAAEFGRTVFRQCGRTDKKKRKQPDELKKTTVQGYLVKYYEDNYNELFTRWGRFFLKACPISSREIKVWEHNLTTYGCIDPFVIQKSTNLPLQISNQNLEES